MDAKSSEETARIAVLFFYDGMNFLGNPRLLVIEVKTWI